LGKEETLFIAVRVASVEGLAVHAAGLWTEVSCGKLPAERTKARIDLDTGLFKTPFQLFNDLTDIVLFRHALTPVYEETSTCPDARFVRMEV
jgi:hypothetical protein